MKKSKGCQLRIRISAEQRERLEQTVKERGREESLSDLVRYGIKLISAAPGGFPLEVSDATRDILKKLSTETSIPSEKIIEACVQGIVDLLDHDRSPLIVEQIKLRRKYAQKVHSDKGSQLADVA